MSKNEKNHKKMVLEEQGVLNKYPEEVRDLLFKENDFFDPIDLVQVKYEMIRQVCLDDKPISQTTSSFGFSRPSFYEARRVLEKEGLVGLVPKKRGPQGGHKLNEEAMNFIKEELKANKTLGASKLVSMLKKRLRVSVHPRSIERALLREKKKQ